MLKLEEPYDRAVAVHLVRRAARDEGLKVILAERTTLYRDRSFHNTLLCCD